MFDLPQLEKLEVHSFGGNIAAEKLNELLSANPQIKKIKVSGSFNSGDTSHENYSKNIKYLNSKCVNFDVYEDFALQGIQNLWCESE